MQTTAPATEEATATKTIAALRKRLSRWELDHLRNHCAELADKAETAQQRVEELEEEVRNAWRWGEHWRDQSQELVTELQEAGKTVGLTIDGELVMMPETQPGASATDPIANALAHAIIPIGTHLPAEGGTLGAIIAKRDGSTYGLIVAESLHEYTGEWGNYGTEIEGTKGPNGAANTGAMLAAGSPIAKAVRTLTIAGHSDWYIPSRLEMLALYESSPELFSKGSYYWTSSQYSRGDAWCQDFEYGLSLACLKVSEFRARPVRRIQLQPSSTSALAKPIAEGDPREILGAEAAA